MSDDWKVGDLAVCVNAQPHPHWPTPLTEGLIYRVSEVLPEWHCELNPLWNGVGLNFIEQRSPSVRGFACERFRKIDRHEPCEEEFRILLKLSKRRVSA